MKIYNENNEGSADSNEIVVKLKEFYLDLSKEESLNQKLIVLVKY